jgi:hypothetical protein
MRYCVVGVLFVLLTGCSSGSQTIIPSSTATTAQAALLATSSPSALATPPAASTLTATLQVARPPTPSPTVLATVGPTPSPAPPQEVPALLDDTPPLTLTVETAAADLAVGRLPQDVLLIETPDHIRPEDDSYRHLLLVDAAGRTLGVPTADLQRVEWCSPHRDAYSPSGSWSANGRYLIATCQGTGFWAESALLDLDQGVWLRVTPPTWPMLHDPDANVDYPSGDDAVDLGPWLIPDEQLIVRLYQEEDGAPGESPRTRESLWIWSLTDATIRRIADFDGPENYPSTQVTVSDDHRLAILGQRADDPQPRVYLWHGGTTLQRLSEATPMPVSALKAPFQNLLVHPSTPYALAPNGRLIAIHEVRGWQIYTDDGHARGLFPDRPVVRGTQARWSADSTSMWICQGERDVGAHLIHLDQDGAILFEKTYPNVVFANAPCGAESASGYRAISLSNPLVVILDSDLREHGTVEGTSLVRSQAGSWECGRLPVCLHHFLFVP